MGVFRKQLLYLTNDQITAYQWKKGGPSASRIFPNDKAGWDDFACYLAGSHNTLTYLLADLIEEDFQRDTLPHVLGMSRRTLVQRRLSQLYRDTPYRQAIRQGREASGRRDDRMLFSALTNVALLKPWLDTLVQQKIPLTGIYSPALLSATLIKKLGLTGDNLLLVSHHSCGLRQSFFQGSTLKFSRLMPLPHHHPDTVAESAAREAASIRQFLTSTRLLTRDETLDVVTLAHEDVLQQIQSTCHDTFGISYRFFNLADAAKLLGVKNPGPLTLCDSLFLSLLGHTLPASHYAQKEQTRYFRLQQLRIFLYLLSAGVFMGGLAWAGANCMTALDNLRQSRQMAVEAQSNQAQYQAIVRDLPHTATSPHNMKVAVTIEQTIARNAPIPAPLLGIVSHALDALPQIRLDLLRWQVGAEGAAALASQQSAPQPGGESNETILSAASIGLPHKPNQTLLIEGEVTPFGDDYRTAMESVRLFAAELGKNKQMQVEITQLPLDIKPTHILTGKMGTGDEDSKARFALKLTLRPEN